eukprot:7182899-Lingulodinium_polyedra.AAC.1
MASAGQLGTTKTPRLKQNACVTRRCRKRRAKKELARAPVPRANMRHMLAETRARTMCPNTRHVP